MRSQPSILLFGPAGQLGSELQRSFRDFTLHLCDRQQADLTRPQEIRKAIQQLKPEIILNAAAYTAVDDAELNPEPARQINATAPAIMAEEAQNLGALFVHYSTDYVFDGSKTGPWTEEDEPRPLNVYGESKLAGERAIVETGGRYLVFRTSWVFGPRRQNFLLTVLRLAKERERLQVVADQFGAPTSAHAIAEATRIVVDRVVSGEMGGAKAWAGIYHMTCAGSTTWYGFAREILDRTAQGQGTRQIEIEGIESTRYPTLARRPKNSVLSNEKLKERFRMAMPSWEDALMQTVEVLVSNDR